MGKRQKGKASLRMKTFTFNLYIVLSALLLFSIISLTVECDRLKKQTLQSAQDTLNQSAVVLQEQTQAFRANVDSLTLDAELLELLSENREKDYNNIIAWNMDYTLLQRKIESLLFRSNISAVVLVTEHAIATADSGVVYPLDQARDTAWYEQIKQGESSYVWSEASSFKESDVYTDEDYVIFTRALPYSYRNYESYFVFYVKRANFEQLMRVNITNEYNASYVLNSANELLFGRDETVAVDHTVIKEWVAAHYQKSDAPIAAQSVDINGHNYYVGSASIFNTDLTLIYSYAFFEIQNDTIWSGISRMALIALAVLPLVLAFSMVFSRSITKPINRLKESMLVVSEGNFDVPIVPPSADVEVRALTQHYNYMLEKISHLLDQQYNYGKQIKELEIRSLQAQINPHFLYNTLELIKWKAVKYKDSDIQEIVSALSQYYRKGLSKGADMVNLQSEIDHITSYVKIQNMRFDNCVHLDIRIEGDALQCMLPKLTLQPLVENAIIHGVLETDEAEGRILIRTFKEQNRLFIAVVDDGCGMTQQKASDLLKQPQESTANGSGYGLHNIQERIKLIFGNEFGLSFLSYPNHGTAVILEIPFEQDGKEDSRV